MNANAPIQIFQVVTERFGSAGKAHSARIYSQLSCTILIQQNQLGASSWISNCTRLMSIEVEDTLLNSMHLGFLYKKILIIFVDVSN